MEKDKMITDKIITIEAKAKINLTLDVLGKRDDGYHDVSMIMQSIGLCDVLTIKKTSAGILLHGDVDGVADMKDNLAYKAAKLIIDTYDIKSGVEIFLQKKIPVAAGLAGGSSDAAAVLRGINDLFELSLSSSELCTLAAQLGSDIPFCVIGGTMLAEGRGEVLTRLPEAPALPLVLVKPKVGVSTAWVYKNYHTVTDTVCHPDNEAMIEALSKGNLDDIYSELGNVLEYVTIPAHEEIAQIKKSLMECGAKAALMSGSGPTVFAIAENNADAQRIAKAMKEHWDADVFATAAAGPNF